jgi:hypothetical protein
MALTLRLPFADHLSNALKITNTEKPDPSGCRDHEHEAAANMSNRINTDRPCEAKECYISASRARPNSGHLLQVRCPAACGPHKQGHLSILVLLQSLVGAYFRGVGWVEW